LQKIFSRKITFRFFFQGIELFLKVSGASKIIAFMADTVNGTNGVFNCIYFVSAERISGTFAGIHRTDLECLFEIEAQM